MNIARHLERSASLFPHRPVVSEGPSEISYAPLNDRSNRVATALMALGLKSGDPVGLNVFVLKGAAPDVPLTVIFRGILPFLVAALLAIVILTIFPEIATFVPSQMGGR